MFPKRSAPLSKATSPRTKARSVPLWRRARTRPSDRLFYFFTQRLRLLMPTAKALKSSSAFFTSGDLCPRGRESVSRARRGLFATWRERTASRDASARLKGQKRASSRRVSQTPPSRLERVGVHRRILGLDLRHSITYRLAVSHRRARDFRKRLSLSLSLSLSRPRCASLFGANRVSLSLSLSKNLFQEVCATGSEGLTKRAREYTGSAQPPRLRGRKEPPKRQAQI